VSYNATSSLLRFGNKICYSTLKNAVSFNNAGGVAVNSKVVGVSPGYFSSKQLSMNYQPIL
jgi:hypothetical protein